MDYVLEDPGTPLPPERVILYAFEIGPQRSKECQIRDNGNSWSLRAPGNRPEHYHAWLLGKGYELEAASNPPTYRRRKKPPESTH